MNWTLEDFYAGKVDASDDGTSLEDINRFLNWPRPLTTKYLYYGRHVASAATTLPSAPISYFISLLDAQEKQPRTVETKEVECYVYEDGYITSEPEKRHCAIKETFTHTIKIPKK